MLSQPGTKCDPRCPGIPSRSRAALVGGLRGYTAILNAMTEIPVVIRSPHNDEFSSWASLFRAYRIFYKLAPDEAVVERVWSWIHDPTHETNALLAATGDLVVGFAHYRRFDRPSAGSVGMYLDDLMTDHDHRRSGVGRALITAVYEIGRRDGCSIVQWITAAENLPGQRLYDSLATKTSWITYDKPIP